MRHLDVEADELAGLVTESERQVVFYVADTQHTPLPDPLQGRSGSFGAVEVRRGLGALRRRSRLQEERAFDEEPVPLVRPIDGLEARAHRAEGGQRQHDGENRPAQQAAAAQRDQAGSPTSGKEGERECVHGRQQGAETVGYDVVGNHEEVEGIGRDPVEVEQEGDGDKRAGKQTEDPRDDEARIITVGERKA